MHVRRRTLLTQRLAPRRVAMLSVHTSPVEQPGTGDAGGLNVYVLETARRMARRGTEVEVFTRATASDVPPVIEAAPGVLVRNIAAGPFEGLSKNDLPGQLCSFAAGVLRTEASMEEGWYDLVHSHYWLSGQVGALVAERWGTPLVHTMHTMAKVKNAALAAGDTPEPSVRVLGEEQVVAASGRLLANTDAEARELIGLYGAPPAHVKVVPPGVDLDVFCPGGPGGKAAARRRLGVPQSARLLLFVGRIQPLKAPDVLVKATAHLLAARPELREDLVVAVLGGPSGSGLEHPTQLQDLALGLHLGDVVRFHPPVRRVVLADWYRAADLVVVPSYNESFGLVAVEAQACGTPVVAAAVGGLRTAVAHDVSGVLVDGHDPRVWARVIADLIEDDGRRRRLQAGAVRRSSAFSWDATVDATLDVYAEAVAHAAAGFHRVHRLDLTGGSSSPRPAASTGGPAAGALALAGERVVS